MKFEELDLMEVNICTNQNIKKEMGLRIKYFPMSKKVEYEYGEGREENEFFSEDELNKILTALLFKESVLDGEYVDDIEELDTLKVGEDYILALYYFLEDVDFSLVRVLRIPCSEVEKLLNKW